MNFNLLDLVFFALTFIFVLTAFFRGLVKEIFALLNWIMALTLSYLLTPYLSDFLAKYFDSKVALDIALRSIIFIAIFIITAFATSGLRKSLKEKIPDIFDRSLGVLFGFAKTLLIFGFAYSLYFNLYGFVLGGKLKNSAMKTPEWLQEAKSYSLIKLSGETIDPLVKKFFDAISANLNRVIPNSKELLDQKIDDVIQEKIQENAVEEIGKALQDSGYNKKDIEKMNRLIEIIDK
ncbi:MAG: hypothetical protein A2887_03845 [Alphaproteobacteria bacterium RIFCSPLOWO2_01_FULL_40_26]|nr:MAG: hypothetical protein A3D15_05000 [Alphaproteobacteria bacterium RIFCSPHIGHO2_02_FULL_40_34]OFW95330.1 MAG: hypothetical protein A2887_03845 [Alphaproteobacteria bacterium RIFCSPLOWO2_01_FULL_40_26]OFX09233.1 MAG: hypothetical protein A3H30_06550 [Alphaproteobacteria bacterium RIFCSPLOWO2_02_FULL_40_19]OFX11588.1 MAG: hypothetical protein A3G22_05155 [Alphaproteobacteria bacterium RIFCSPLOWO2_12_FULL_40_11]